jgi:hypothetical protein
LIFNLIFAFLPLPSVAAAVIITVFPFPALSVFTLPFFDLKELG